MLIGFFGVSSGLAHSTAMLLKAAFDAVRTPLSLFSINDVAALRANWTQIRDMAESHVVIIASDTPDDEFIQLLERVAVPKLIIVEDLVDSIFYMKNMRNMRFVDSVRFCTQTIATLYGLHQSAQSVTFSAKAYEASIDDIMSALAAGVGLSRRRFEGLSPRLDLPDAAILRDYCARHFPAPLEIKARQSSEPAQERALAERIADAYTAIAIGARLRTVEWPTELFLDWDTPGAFLAKPIELVGPARFIICGPYLHLPVGRWRAVLHFEIADNLSGNRLGVDLFAKEILVETNVDLPPEGQFALSLDFDNPSAYAPLETRIQITSGAIEGSLRLLRVFFEPGP